MSRAYRIEVAESVHQVIRGEDHVSTRLEVLEILPCEQMAELLEQELAERGFEREGDVMIRKDGEIVIEVNPADGTVTVRSEAEEDVTVQGKRVGHAYDDAGPGRRQTERQLRDELQKDLAKQVEQQEEELQQKSTDRLEAALGNLREELDQISNRITAEALKRKAAQLGNIKEMTEDEEGGSLTIVVDV